MKDMKAHLEKLRDQAAECALRSGEAKTREHRELFAKISAHLNWLTDQVEAEMNGAVHTDTFLGRTTQKAFSQVGWVSGLNM